MDLLKKEEDQESGFDYSAVNQTVSQDGSATVTIAEEIVSIEDIKRYAHYDIELDDDIIKRQISAVRSAFEKICNMSFIDKTITAYWYTHPSRIRLPFGPVTQVNHVWEVDQGDETEMDEGDYYTEGVSHKFLCVESYLPIKVEYETGLTNEDEINLVKEAICTEVAEWFMTRGNTSTNQLYEVSNNARMKLSALQR